MRTEGEGRSGSRNIRLTVEYDGSDFEGFQVQPNRRTVQGELEFALRRLTGCHVRIHGAGRTDAGVHAVGQVVSFSFTGAIPVNRMTLALNRGLPPDIRVIEAAEAGPGFHARYSAKARVYEYTILNSRKPEALRHRFVWRIRKTLDERKMADAGRLFIGRFDFGAFGSAEAGKSTQRDVFDVSVCRDGELIKIVICANAFLRHMARAVTGALADIGAGVREPDEIVRALEMGTVSPPFSVAPPNGLCLVRVEY